MQKTVTPTVCPSSHCAQGCGFKTYVHVLVVVIEKQRVHIELNLFGARHNFFNLNMKRRVFECWVSCACE